MILPIILMIQTLVCASRCYQYKDMENLQKYLFDAKRYNRDIRPIQNQSQQIVIQYMFAMDSVNDLDVTNGHLMTTSVVVLFWKDEFLTWNVSDYGGISKISTTPEKIWIPPLSQKSGARQERTGTVVNPGFAPVQLSNDGQIMLATANYFQTACKIDIQLFPFDRHECTFIFFSSKYDQSEMMFHLDTVEVNMDHYNENDAWIITDVRSRIADMPNVASGTVVPTVESSVYIRRRPEFQLINRYCPMLLITLLNSMGCFIPPNSGERLSFAVTLYLAFLYQTAAVIDDMPQNAVDIAVTSYILLIANALNTISVAWGIFVVRMSTWDQSSVPVTLKNLVKRSRKRNKEMNLTKVVPVDEDQAIYETKLDQDHSKQTEDIHQSEREDEYTVTWLRVAKYFDWIYSVCNILLNTIAVSALVVMWTAQTNTAH